MDKKTPNWRSMMFVPTYVDRFVKSAAGRGADACILALEDSIPVAKKAESRKLVSAAADAIRSHGADVVVRINRPWRLAVRDIEASVNPKICALAIPKVADASHIKAVAEILTELELERGMEVGHTGLIAMIESADAYFEAREIAMEIREKWQS